MSDGYEGIGPPEDNGHVDEPVAIPIQCCFLIIVDNDGGSQVVLDTAQRFHAVRMATPKDIYSAVANVMADFQALKTAEAVMNLTRQMTEQMAAQQQMAEIRRKLGT